MCLALVVTIFKEFDDTMDRNKMLIHWIKILAVYMFPFVVVAVIFGLLMTV